MVHVAAEDDVKESSSRHGKARPAVKETEVPRVRSAGESI